MSVGTTMATPTPIIAITVQDRSPPDFRSALASVNRPESIGTTTWNEPWRPIFEMPELSSVAYGDAGSTIQEGNFEVKDIPRLTCAETALARLSR